MKFQQTKDEMKQKNEYDRVDNFRKDMIKKQMEGLREGEQMRKYAAEQNLVQQKQYREAAIRQQEQANIDTAEAKR